MHLDVSFILTIACVVIFIPLVPNIMLSIISEKKLSKKLDVVSFFSIWKLHVSSIA
jgi:hypothetical protein